MNMFLVLITLTKTPIENKIFLVSIGVFASFNKP